jgi:serine/threonine protein kinase/Flp pilus assembly protein TadD
VSTDVETIGDFEVVREIGRGGMGVVYEARQVSLNRRVALKVLPGIGRSSGQAVERFRREASSAAKLTHPNIIQVYAFGEERGHHFIAMEYVDGPSFERVLLEGKCPDLIESEEATFALDTDRTVPIHHVAERPVSKAPCPDAMARRKDLDRYLRILIDTARALHAAHEMGVLHRDVKPANILLDSRGHVKLADFGLARREAAGDTVTSSGEVLGTLAYMSPEQVAPKRVPITRRADVYALGITLYEILSGRRPFEHPTAHVVMHMIQTVDPPRPRKHDPTVPKDLEIICLKAIEKDPERRYPTALEFAEDLERFLSDEPILARPASTLTRVVRFVRRRKVPIAASLLLLAAAVVIIGLLQRGRAKEAEAAARQTAWNKGVAQEKVERSLMRTLGGQASEVLAMLDEAERLDPTRSDVHLHRGLLYFNMDQPEKALADIELGLQKEPGDASLLFARGMVLRFMGQESESWEKVRGHLDTVSDPMRLMALGTFQTTNGFACDAVRTFELAKRKKPEWPQSRFGLALAHYRLRRFDQSLEVLKSFLDLDPGHAVGHALLVMLHALRAQSAEGYERARIVKEAKDALAQMTEIAPEEPLTAGVAAAVASLDAGEAGKPALLAALSRIDESLEATPPASLRVSGGIVYELAAVLSAPIDRERARKYANEALAIRRGTDMARVVLADLDAHDGKLKGAIDRYRGVVRDYPQSPVAAARLLQLRVAHKDSVPDAEAIKLVDLIIQIAPEDPEILEIAADAAATLGRKAEAHELYRSAEALYRRRGNSKMRDVADRLATL